tara:strand:+ start:610 stop:1155 length:546 start_codon:yes stop_codon:yes gene_type:complete
MALTIYANGKIESSSGGLQVPTNGVWVTGGITIIDTWRLTSDMGVPDGYVTSNWARATDTMTKQLGSAVTESSGLFTLPETGVWRINLQLEIYSGQESRWVEGQIHGSTDGSSFSRIANGLVGIFDTSGNVHQSLTASTYYNVTNTSNNKIKVYLSDAGSATNESNSIANVSFIEFAKVGM